MEQIHYSVWLLGKRNWSWSKNRFCYFDQKISNGRLHFAGSRHVRMLGFAMNIMPELGGILCVELCWYVNC